MVLTQANKQLGQLLMSALVTVKSPVLPMGGASLNTTSHAPCQVSNYEICDQFCRQSNADKALQTVSFFLANFEGHKEHNSCSYFDSYGK